MPSNRSSAPIVHSVQFYDHDEALIARLSNIITSAIETGNSVLVIATEQHRQDLTKSLEKRINDLQNLKSDGRLNLLDADEALSLFMANDLPDRDLFSKSVGELVGGGKSAAWNGHRGLTVFGEMVSVLWERGNFSGALALEELWNEMLNEYAFHLHCAYPKSLFSRQDGHSLIAAICDGHSHVIGKAA